ncbi:hypothetical protein C4D60_Mb04t19320 [Musa balbisiana]|uniref:Uncharacterized protein n=1 Tax=Musa balbisiana TaxID=52838 RepID=A0A4S8KDA7_MUSBA|nr:hypothetical protein C4D60_Mb04t19320 [Musa balbisiana]
MKMMAGCIPRARSNRPVTAHMSLLERIREVVFKLIMLSAMLKSTGTGAQREKLRKASIRASKPPDSYRSEAVEDCIEYVKRSAGVEKSSSGVGNDDDVVVELGFTAFPPVE